MTDVFKNGGMDKRCFSLATRPILILSLQIFSAFFRVSTSKIKGLGNSVSPDSVLPLFCETVQSLIMNLELQYKFFRIACTEVSRYEQ